MKILIWGYGRMGKEVEKAALSRGHQIVEKIDLNNINSISEKLLKKTDVAIEFTTPESAPANYIKCFEAGLPVVSGTTGWLDKEEEIKNICKEKNGTFFYASNFSLGVNIFFEVNKFLAKLMNKINQYDVSIEETHHIHKKDKPSGTAITIARQIIENNERYNSWKLNAKEPGILPVYSTREGEIVGIHTVNYTSKTDKISITHEAFSREGFAQGAVIAAEFVKDKKGCYTMEDLLRML
jgi:4-hydroxy-tetrahydrodipicolinate reductase